MPRAVIAEAPSRADVERQLDHRARVLSGCDLPAEPGPWATALAIRFVRLAGDTVSGALDPYTGSACDCPLRTTFTGVPSGNRIAGTFATVGGGGATALTGRWSVERRR